MEACGSHNINENDAQHRRGLLTPFLEFFWKVGKSQHNVVLLIYNPDKWSIKVNGFNDH